MSKDFGVVGQTFEIIEVDMLDYIKAKLNQMEQDGVIAGKQAEMKQRLDGYVSRPNPVEGIVHTIHPKVRIYDPSYILQEDIKDQDGDIIHKKGTVINPLDTSPLPTELLFIDGDNQSQVNWAVEHSKSIHSKIILIKGAPMELMEEHKTRMYFDQKGLLVGRFGITQVPAKVAQKGNKLLIEEFRLEGN